MNLKGAVEPLGCFFAPIPLSIQLNLTICLPHFTAHITEYCFRYLYQMKMVGFATPLILK